MKKLLLAPLLMLTAGCSVVRPGFVTPTDRANGRLYGSVTGIDEYFFDVSGNKTVEDEDYDTLTSIEYNRAGNITSQKLLSGPEGTLSTWDSYSYDDSGHRLLTATYFNARANISDTFTYHYDRKGRIVRITDLTGTVETIFRNDRKGYKKSETRMVDGEVKGETTFRYDAKGRLRRQKDEDAEIRYYYRGGRLRQEKYGKTFTVDYDMRGNVNSTTNLISINDETGNTMMKAVITADYVYDKQGNWIRMTQEIEGRTIGVRKRDITYGRE